MAIYLCHEQPDLYVHSATVVDARPGAVALSRSAFHPGGGGQVSDIGMIEWSGGAVGVHRHRGRRRRVVAPARRRDGIAVGRGRGTRRCRPPSGVASLHTASHILNAFVFGEFAGALVTGAQINGDGTGRMDFDLPEVDNDRWRARGDPVNDVIARGVDVTAVYVDAGEAATTEGLVRSMSVAPPPTPDGRLRLIDIEGIDRQACGGTHLSNTGPVATDRDHQGREQGPPQPPRALRLRAMSFTPLPDIDREQVARVLGAGDRRVALCRPARRSRRWSNRSATASSSPTTAVVDHRRSEAGNCRFGRRVRPGRRCAAQCGRLLDRHRWRRTRPRRVAHDRRPRGPLSSVDDQFAWDEGEGDRTRDSWLEITTHTSSARCRRSGSPSTRRWRRSSSASS